MWHAGKALRLGAKVGILASIPVTLMPCCSDASPPSFPKLLESRKVREFEDKIPGPAKIRLITTPHENSPSHEPTVRGLASLCFQCNRCGAVIAPQGSVWRTTVAPTPIIHGSGVGSDPSQLSNCPKDMQDSVFSDETASSYVKDESPFNKEAPRSGQWRPHLYARAANKGPPLVFCRVYCRKCNLHVGMHVRREHDGVFERYKFISFRDTRGWVLRLADPSLWAAVKSSIPPSPPPPPTPPRNLERAENVSHALPARPGGMTVETAIDSSNGLLNAGLSTPLFRSLRLDEDISLGLHPKNAMACAHPSEHVTHGSKPTTTTQFTSLSEDPSVPMLWAWPWGRVCVIAPVLARSLSVKSGKDTDIFIPNEKLLEMLAADSKQYHFADRSHEALASTPISADATDVLSWHFAPVDDAPGGFKPPIVSPPNAAPSFPRSLSDLFELSETVRGPSLSTDMGATLLSITPKGYDAKDYYPADFVVVRMSRNSLPSHNASGSVLGVDEVIALGRAQLFEAFELTRASSSSLSPMSYYEADIAYSQPRRVTNAIPVNGVLKRVPFILVKVPPKEDMGGEELLQATLKLLYEKKKGHSQ